MILKTSYRKLAVYTISLLFIVLFIYAAVSKLLDFETFTVQLAQSPLLSAYADVIAWLVPGIEIAISILLLFERFRPLALYAAYTLMVMFTAYIYIILNFSDFIPCSCGGVLEKLSWTEHLIFNIAFIVLSALAILLSNFWRTSKKIYVLLILIIFGIGTVTILFTFSEKKIHRNNAFQRRYPHHPANEERRLDIKYNSYYIAGIGQDSIYLGNTTAPLHLLVADLDFSDTVYRKIKIARERIPFQALNAKVKNPFLYLTDGTVPIVLKGKLKDLRLSQWAKLSEQYIETLSISDTLMVMRTFDKKTTRNVLGILNIGDSINLKNYPQLLTAYGDPFFDTDGILLYNEQLKKIVFVYYYRNEFVVLNTDLSIDYNGKTIDTISNAQLDIRIVEGKNEKTFGTNPIFVNSLATTYGKYLFIASDRLGKYEPEGILKEASIIDVYNLRTQEYSFSFYLYHIGLKKLKEFKVDGIKLYAVIDHYLLSFELKKENFDNISIE